MLQGGEFVNFTEDFILKGKNVDNKLFKTLFNFANEGIVFVAINEDGTIGNFIEINDAVIRRLRYTKKELEGMTIFDLVIDSEIDKVKKAAKELLEKNQVVYEGTLLTKDKQILDIEISGHILDLEGSKVGLFIGRNITESKAALRALRESEERYRKLMELLPDAVNIKHNNIIVYSNEEGAKLYRFDNVKDIIGQDDMELTHEEYRKMSIDRGDKIRTIGEKAPLVEGKIIRKDGVSVDVEVASTAVDYNGETAVLSVIRDISERKKSEEALRKTMAENELLLEKAVENEKQKTELFMNISHEFKTPLNVILGIIQLLKRNSNNRVLDKNAYERYVEVMRQNCYRLLRLINNLIDVNKADSEYMELNLRNHDIVSMIEDVTQSISEYAKDKGVSIIFDTEVEEKVIACDEEKIERIMLNLISNAIKFNKENGMIFVNIYNMEEDSILVSVKDTGRGIPENKLEEVFYRFKQVDPLLTRSNEGSGIGLALVKSLIEKHEGEIWVESTYGEGTEFFFRLPNKVVEDRRDIKEDKGHIGSLIERINVELSDIYKIN
jgi:PAS domain S-box-containing protein